MAVYNGAAYLKQAVDSILDQSFADFEVIIVDDGSTDATPSIIESYSDPRLVCLRNSFNMGLTRSLNRGLSVARGTYVARQDADDESLPERLSYQVAFLDAHPDVSVLGTAYREVYDDGRASRLVRIPIQHEEICAQLFYHHVFCHGSVMMRRAALNAVAGYDERFLVAQDRALWLRLAERHRFAGLSEVLYQFRMSSTSITGTRRSSQRQYARMAVMNALERKVLQPPARSLGRFYWLVAMDELANENRTEAAANLHLMTSYYELTGDEAYGLAQLAVYRAYELVQSSTMAAMDVEGGLSFLRELFELVPARLTNLKAQCQWALSELCAACAFSAYRRGDHREAVSQCSQALMTHGSQLRNRGLLSIGLRSLLHFSTDGTSKVPG